MTTKRTLGKKTTKVLSYSGMATALLAMAHDADAQVIYTDVNPDLTFTNDVFEIDFDGDAVTDLTIMHVASSSSSSSMVINVNAVAVNAAEGNAFKGNVQGSYAYASVLAAGDAIAPGAGFQTSYGTCAFAISIPGLFATTYGDWAGQTGYVGCKFEGGDGQTHYGWVHLSVATGVTSATVLAYGYESTPNTAISAGDMGTTTGIGTVAEKFNFNIAPNPTKDQAVIGLQGVKGQNVTVSVIDAMGKVMFTEQVSAMEETHTLDLSNLAQGTYFVRLENGKEVAFRKVTKS